MNKKSYKKKLAFTREYNKEHYKSVSFRLDYDRERDIIDWLDNYDSNKAYLVSLIKKDMRRKGVTKRG